MSPIPSSVSRHEAERDGLLSLAALIIVSLNVALDSGSREGTTVYDLLSPFHCLHETVHTLVGAVYSSEPNNNRPEDVLHLRCQPFIRLLNVLAVLAFCASLLQDGHVWHKLLLANAMLCWLVRNTTNRTNRPPPAPAPVMTSDLISALLEHSIVFVTTAYFDPNDPQCWMWLAITCAPVALLSCLLSRPEPGAKQELGTEVLASLLHLFFLGALWQVGFSPLAKDQFARHDLQIMFLGLGDSQFLIVFLNACALRFCILEQKHRMAGRIWPAVMTALLWSIMVGYFYLDCYPLYRLFEAHQQARSYTPDRAMKADAKTHFCRVRCISDLTIDEAGIQGSVRRPDRGNQACIMTRPAIVRQWKMDVTVSQYIHKALKN
jgi:hypothetical protein